MANTEQDFFLIDARLTVEVTVTVHARDVVDAMKRFQAGDFDYDPNQVSMVDWKPTSQPTKDV